MIALLTELALAFRKNIYIHTYIHTAPESHQTFFKHNFLQLLEAAARAMMPK